MGEENVLLICCLVICFVVAAFISWAAVDAMGHWDIIKIIDARVQG